MPTEGTHLTFVSEWSSTFNLVGNKFIERRLRFFKEKQGFRRVTGERQRAPASEAVS